MKLPQFPRSSPDRPCASLSSLVVLVVACLLSPIATLIASEPLAKGIQDNSFFVEEAYNQEPGVVQHIINVPALLHVKATKMFHLFTQEWPIFSQTHQFSYTIPYTFTESENGFRDIFLNYRCKR